MSVTSIVTSVSISPFSYNNIFIICIHHHVLITGIHIHNWRFNSFFRYIELLMRLATFETFKQHPGHFNKIVHSHVPVYGIIQIIRDETHTVSNNIAIFTDKTRSMDAMLPPDSTLEDCGFHGGTLDHPEELLLYYDYKVDFVDCPILLCDHYFKKKLKS